MDVATILRTMSRHRVTTAAVALLTLAACAFAYVAVRPVYEAASGSLLIQPPPAPTEEDVTADPSLAGVDADNPYVRYDDPAVIISVVSRRVTSDAVRERLVDRGAVPDYDVAPSRRFGLASPILDVTVEAPTEEEALASLRIVRREAVRQMRELQEAEGVDPRYMYSTRLIDEPQEADEHASRRLRAVLALAALGGLALWAALGVQVRLAARRRSGIG